MRIIIILLVIFLVYLIVKSLFKKRAERKIKTKKSIEYCKFCKAYVTPEEYCLNKNINYKDCKNYK